MYKEGEDMSAFWGGKALAEVKSELEALEAHSADIEAKVKTIAEKGATDLKAAVVAADPGVKGQVEALITQLVMDLEKALIA
jgi:hypothetical protein